MSLIQGYQGTIELKIAKYYLNLGVYDLILFDVVGQFDFICIKVGSFNLSEIKFEVYNCFLIWISYTEVAILWLYLSPNM